MNLLRILFFINIIKFIASLHLDSYQIKLINNLIQNPELKPVEREKVNDVLYNAYEKFAVKKALDFKTFHKHKCINMKKEEFIFSSKIGLFKSIQKYNGKHDFANYATIYINSELLKLLTDKYSLSSLPKSYRSKRKHKYNYSNDYDTAKYNYLLDVKLSILYEPWQLDSIFVSNENFVDKILKKYEENEKIEELMNNIQGDFLFVKRILYLKYYYHTDTNTVLSNNYISKLMCCSEETIREKLKYFKI